MGFGEFFGFLLLGTGPLVVAYAFTVARKSFLVLLSLGSAFYWLVTLFVVSALFRGFAPLQPSVGPYVGLVLVAVLVQEVARFGLWRFHMLMLRVLDQHAHESSGACLSQGDRTALALTHGLAQAAAHSLFFFVSWLPLSLGDGTIYSARCPAMSFYLVGALATLGMAGVLAGGMVLALDGLERRDLRQGLLPSGMHLAAALLTLASFAQGGCLVAVPLLLAGGAASSAAAGQLWWRRVAAVPRLARTSPTAAEGDAAAPQ